MRDVAWLFIISDPCPYRWVVSNNRMVFRRMTRPGGFELLAEDPYAIYLAQRATRTAPRVVAVGKLATSVKPVDLEVCGDSYSFACDLEPKLVVKPEKGADFPPLISRLATVSGQRWQAGFTRSVRLLTTGDHRVLATALQEKR